MHKRRALAALLILVGLVLAAGVLAAGALAYDSVSRVQPRCNDPKGERQFTPAHFQIDGLDTAPYQINTFEEVTFQSRDQSVHLSGFFIPADRPNAPAVIIVHGLSACKRHPNTLLPAGMLHRQGFTVLAIDLRDMGDSAIEDGRQSAGTREYQDVLGAWDRLVNEKQIAPERIGLFGYSLGGSAAIVAAGEEPRIAAIWTDSAFADIERVITDLLSQNRLPLIIKPAALLIARLVSGDDFTSHKPVQAITRFGQRPVFIVHGESDTIVPVAHAHLLAEAAQTAGVPIELWVSSDKTHVGTMLVDPHRYETLLVAFFTVNLGG